MQCGCCCVAPEGRARCRYRELADLDFLRLDDYVCAFVLQRHTDKDASIAASGRNLRFLANVDPVDIARALSGLDAETTLVIVVSKTFTTAETMLNARTMKKWLLDNIKNGVLLLILLFPNISVIEIIIYKLYNKKN